MQDNSYDDEDNFFGEQKSMINALNSMRRIFLDRKPHIKEYYKIRNMHSEIISAMIQYHRDGKFKEKADPDFVSESRPEVTVHLLESNFDLDTNIGADSFYDMVIYKTSSNVTCITDDFIRNHRYKKPEKVEFLHSMLDSKLGLFEVTGTDMGEGYAYIKDVFTGAEYTLIDIGLSGNRVNDNYYVYTRIITYHKISFGAGLNFVFAKTDNFIKNHIQEHKKNFNPKGEFLRFIQLYNHYSQDSGRVITITNEL
jgi:hypothetical protein